MTPSVYPRSGIRVPLQAKALMKKICCEIDSATRDLHHIAVRTAATAASGLRNSSGLISLSHDGTARRSVDEHHSNGGIFMDKDRIKGAAEQAKGKVKEQAGKLTGDEKLKSEGKVDKAAGKIRNTVGGLKDSMRDS